MSNKGVTLKDVPSDAFIKAYAEHLKQSKKIDLPQWLDLVKTGCAKELSPYDKDWYFIRAASMARKIYLKGGIGIGGFRKIYGCTKNNGASKSHFSKSSGAIARSVLKNLEKLGFVEHDANGGRKITNEGQRDIDKVARSLVVN